MTFNQWLALFEKAFEYVDEPYSLSTKDFLCMDYPENISNAEQEKTLQIIEIFTRYFCAKASHGETFCPVEIVESEFGKTLEENYGLSEGPFMNLARTYWTFRFAVDDFPSDKLNTVIHNILRAIEISIAGLFFPTPGIKNIPVNKRIEGQKIFLKECLSDIDIERFLSENPLLKLESSRKGCFGNTLVFILIVVLFVGVFC